MTPKPTMIRPANSKPSQTTTKFGANDLYTLGNGEKFKAKVIDNAPDLAYHKYERTFIRFEIGYNKRKTISLPTGMLISNEK